MQPDKMPFQLLCEAIGNYLKSSPLANNLPKDVERLHFSIDIIRTGQNEMTFSWPMITIDKAKIPYEQK